MGLYANKSATARELGIGRSTVWRLEKGIEEEIRAGRYSPYAIADGLLNRAVVLDYMKYRRLLRDKNARKYVPPFNPLEAAKYLGEGAEA